MSRLPFWRARLLVPCLALLGLNAAAFLVFTLPRGIQERTQNARAATLRREVERQRQTTAALARRADTERANAVDAERLLREVLRPRNTALLPTLEEIEEIAGEPGLRAGRRNFKPLEMRGTPLTRMLVTVPLRGTYQQLVRFLERVERSPRFLTVDRISIARGLGDRADEANLQVEMSAYFRAGGEASSGG